MQTPKLTLYSWTSRHAETLIAVWERC